MSEMIGALALVVVFVALAAIFLVNLTQFYPPEVLPDPRIDVYNETYSHSGENTVYITSLGGNPLPENQYSIKIHNSTGYHEIPKSQLQNVNSLPNKDIKTGNKLFFFVGETPGNKYDIQTVDIIYHNLATGSDTLMYRKGLLKPLGPESERVFYVRIMVTSSSTYPTSPQVTAGGQVIPPGPYVEIPVTSGQLALLAEGAVLNNIWLSTGLLDTPGAVKSSGSLVGNPGGRITYDWTQPVNEDITILVDFRDPIVRIFNTGGDGVVNVGGQTLLPDPGGSGEDFYRNIDALLPILFQGVSGGVIDDLKVVRGLVNSGYDVLSSGNQVSEAVGGSQFTYGLYNETNVYSFDDRATGDESHDFSVAVDFSGSEPTRTVRVINLGPGGIVRYKEETILSGVNQNLTVPQSGINDLLVQGQSNFPIQTITFISGIYTDANSVWSNPSHGNVTGATGQESYTWSIPPGDSDYTIVTQFQPSAYKTIRIINQGPDGIVLANGETVNPGEVKEVYVLDGDSFDMNVTSQNGRVINTIAYTQYLTNDPDVVLNTGTTLGDATGEQQYDYQIDEVRNDYTFVVNFTTPQYTVRVFNDGGGVVDVNGTLINPGEYMDFSLSAGDDFSALFDGQGLATIGELDQMSGIAPDAATVFGNGTSISGAIGQGTYTHTIPDITGSYSIAVRFNPTLYSVDASACIGGSIEKPGVTTYLPGDTPTYNITATTPNRTYQLLIDGQPASFPSGLRNYMYQFDPLTANHTIHINFAINGAKGNYWNNAYIYPYDPDPLNAQLPASMNRYVTLGQNSGIPIDSNPNNWNGRKTSPYIRFADNSGINKFGPSGSCIVNSMNDRENCSAIRYTRFSDDNNWPTNIAGITSANNFYVNWTGLLFLELPGSYTFWTRADDGLKFFIDGKSDPGNRVTVDSRAWIKPYPPDWADYYSITTNPSVHLPGWHDYILWFYDYGGHAEAELRYQPPGEQQNPLNSQFFQELYYLPTSCTQV